jgi:hypothetical protein
MEGRQVGLESVGERVDMSEFFERETRVLGTGSSRAELEIDIRRSPLLGSDECHSALRKDELLAMNDLGGRIPGQLLGRSQTRLALDWTASLASLAECETQPGPER